MKVALVTGAGQGIGKAIAVALAAEGYRVAVCDLNIESASTVAGEVGGKSFGFDVSDIAGIPGLVERVVSECGEVSALVNCAGICRTESIEAITPENWEKTFAVNVEGAFFLARECAERMKTAGGGAIVNLASVSGFLPKLEQLSYGASKAALVSVTRSMAAIYGPYGVRVNAVAPGVIETPLTRTIAEQRASIRGVSPEETLAPVVGATPLRRIGAASEVADTVVYLLSEKSSFVTGQCLDVCGGQLMR